MFRLFALATDTVTRVDYRNKSFFSSYPYSSVVFHDVNSLFGYIVGRESSFFFFLWI